MGRKRPRTRKLVYFCVAGLIFLLLSGCTFFKEKEKVEFSREEVHAGKAQKENLPQKEETSILSKHLLRARIFLEQRDYEGSLKENQEILSLSGQNPPGDEAIFNMGLIYAHFGNPKKDYNKSIGFFKRLVKEYPQSPFAEQAKVWRGILQENEKLNQTIQKLNQVIEESKQVDIEVEERKREKAK